MYVCVLTMCCDELQGTIFEFEEVIIFLLLTHVYVYIYAQRGLQPSTGYLQGRYIM